MTVQTWPGEDSNDPRFDRTFVYGAYWEAGLRIFDVSDVPHPGNDLAEYLAIMCMQGHSELNLVVIGELRKLANGWNSRILTVMGKLTVVARVMKMVAGHRISTMPSR